MNFFKKIGRKTAKIHTKINRVFVPVASAAAGFIGGAPAAAAVTAAGAQASYYFRATQARNEGKMGHDARALGRGERKRVAIYGAAGGGAGMLGSGAANLIAGKSLSSALGATVFGQGGSNILGIDNAVFAKTPTPPAIVTAGNLGSIKGSSVPGLVTQSQLAASLKGGAAEAIGAAAAPVAGGGTTSTLTTALGLATKLGEAYGKSKDTHRNSDPAGNPFWFTPDGTGGGGGAAGDAGGGGGFFNSPVGPDGQPGMSPAMILALGVGAYLLFS